MCEIRYTVLKHPQYATHTNCTVTGAHNAGRIDTCTVFFWFYLLGFGIQSIAINLCEINVVNITATCTRDRGNANTKHGTRNNTQPPHANSNNNKNDNNFVVSVMHTP